jgi:hypothetical protein
MISLQRKTVIESLRTGLENKPWTGFTGLTRCNPLKYHVNPVNPVCSGFDWQDALAFLRLLLSH